MVEMILLSMWSYGWNNWMVGTILL